MLKLLTGGGLGDAAMAFAKLHGSYATNIKLTHVETHFNLLDSIREFYDSQGINSQVIQIPSWQWKIDNEKKYDAWVDTNWEGINPFPPIKYNQQPADILICPASGRNSNRQYSRTELEKIDSERVTYVGQIGLVDGLKGNSLLGITTIKQLIDLICSANTIIAFEGFIAYLGAMAGKKVFVKRRNMNAIKKRKHPDWDFHIIDQVDQILL